MPGFAPECDPDNPLSVAKPLKNLPSQLSEEDFMTHALNLTLPIKQDAETLKKLQQVKAAFEEWRRLSPLNPEPVEG